MYHHVSICIYKILKYAIPVAGINGTGSLSWANMNALSCVTDRVNFINFPTRKARTMQGPLAVLMFWATKQDLIIQEFKQHQTTEDQRAAYNGISVRVRLYPAIFIILQRKTIYLFI